jgi:hypothetical protein
MTLGGLDDGGREGMNGGMTYDGWLREIGGRDGDEVSSGWGPVELANYRSVRHPLDDGAGGGRCISQHVRLFFC